MTDVRDVSPEKGSRISFQTVVPAPPTEVFALLADPSRHAEIDGSGTVRGAVGGSRPLTGVGDKFGMSMRIGLPYLIRNTVEEFEQDRLIAWRHLGRHRWRYELEPVDGGTQVTESFDWSTALAPFIYGPAGFLDAHRQNIPATLERLKAVFS